MTALYYETHTFFKFELTPHDKATIWGSEEIDMCKQYLGENDPYQVLTLRKWFSAPDGIYIRNDCLDNRIATWFALKRQV